jgi:hypothetical protein
VKGGSNVNFTVTATGTAPLRYQWTKDGAAIPGAISQTLALSQVKRTNSGNYSVTVTNVAGAVTSSNAVLRVMVPQRFVNSFQLPDGSVAFQALDQDGGVIPLGDLAGFQVLASTNLVNWQSISNVLTVTNGMLLLQDSEQGQYPNRFYRILEQ